jgi:glycosyltransferase involved in cell wall biosynthesis
MPVFNGENYIRRAIESALAQSYTDFELLIVDNNSTDSTAAICDEYAKKDSRITYSKNPRNIGIHPNFNKCIDLTTSEYFCWLAHDDELHPDYLRKCVAVLDAQPDVVLVHTAVDIMDELSKSIAIYDPGIKGADADRIEDRFRGLTHIRHTCTAMFGLARRDVLKQTRLFSANHHAADRAMLAELSLLGKILQLDEVLFRNREHRNRYVRKIRPSERSAFLQRNTKNNTIESSQLMLLSDYKAAVDRHVTDPETKKRCKKVLSTWWFREWNILRLLVELVSVRAPWIYDKAKWLSDRFIAPKHPTVYQGKRVK